MGDLGFHARRSWHHHQTFSTGAGLSLQGHCRGKWCGGAFFLEWAFGKPRVTMNPKGAQLINCMP